MVVSGVIGGVANRLRRFDLTTVWRDRLILLVTWAFASWPWLRGAGFTNGDNVAYFFPQSSFVVRSLLHGDLPWWNPYLHAGQPVLGDPQSMIFTPHTLIGLILGRHFNLHAYDVTSLTCILCGGLALHQYGRRYTDQRLWPLLGALVFMFGGVATSRLQHVGEIVSYSLLPLMLLAIRGACELPNLWRVFLLAFACLALILNPNQVVFLAVFGLLPFFVMHAWQSQRPLRAALACGCAAAIALAAATPMLLAMDEFLKVSTRMWLPLWESSAFSFSLFHLPGLVIPGLFGMASKNLRLWSPTDADSDYIYIGILPGCLLLWSFIRLPKLQTPALIALAMAILSFVFALGTNASLYPFLFDRLPGFSGFHRPGDAAFLMNFFIAVLMAVLRPGELLPMAAWRPPGLKSFATVASMGILCAAVALTAWPAVRALDAYAISRSYHNDFLAVARNGAARLLIFLTAISLPWCFGRRFARSAIPPILITLTTYDLCSAGRFSPVHLLSYNDSTMARIDRQGRPDPATSAQLETVAFLRKNDAVNDPHGSRAEIIGGGLSLNMPKFQRIFATQGYSPVVLKTYADVIGVQTLAVEPKVFSPAANGYDSEAYRNLGLHYVLFDEAAVQDRSPPPGVVPREMQLRALLALGGPSLARPLGVIGAYEVWEMQNAYPRVGLLPRGTASGACNIQRYRNVFIKIACQAQQPATLVIADNAAPGWLACVNGAPEPISTYAGFLRSVQIPAGADTITLRYQPVPLFRGTGCE
jgi:hypothetical protein